MFLENSSDNADIYNKNHLKLINGATAIAVVYFLETNTFVGLFGTDSKDHVSLMMAVDMSAHLVELDRSIKALIILEISS